MAPVVRSCHQPLHPVLHQVLDGTLRGVRCPQYLQRDRRQYLPLQRLALRRHPARSQLPIPQRGLPLIPLLHGGGCMLPAPPLVIFLRDATTRTILPPAIFPDALCTMFSHSFHYSNLPLAASQPVTGFCSTSVRGRRALNSLRNSHARLFHRASASAWCSSFPSEGSLGLPRSSHHCLISRQYLGHPFGRSIMVPKS